MDINRDNYIIWITDFYDGSLSAIEKEALFVFLDMNPDLKMEFDDYERMVIHPDISTRIDKSLLKKSSYDIDIKKLEEYAIAIHENDLPPDKIDEVTEMLHAVPTGKALMKEYEMIKLAPTGIVYPFKKELKRIPLRSRVYRIVLQAVSAAAMIAVIVSVFVLLPGKSSDLNRYTSSRILPFNSEATRSLTSPNKLIPVLSNNRIAIKAININKEPQIFTQLEANSLNKEPEPVREGVSINQISFNSSVSIATTSTTTALAFIEPADITNSLINSSDLSPRQFLAMNFRKHLLKEDVSNINKLKPHEVADVSIDGLNKLLGWDMQFEKEKGADGTLDSFTFTSQLINLDRKKKKVIDRP